MFKLFDQSTKINHYLVEFRSLGQIFNIDIKVEARFQNITTILGQNRLAILYTIDQQGRSIV